MSKKIKKFLSCIFAFVLAVSLFNIDIRANEKKTDQMVIEEMMNMQDQITETLRVEDNRYVYDYAKIKEIVFNYNFEDFNQIRGTNYTNESFLQLAIHSIENTDLTPQIITTGICGQTWVIEDWNYVRTAQTKAVSDAFVNDARNYAEICASGGVIGGTITSSVPALAVVLVAAMELGALYYNTFANNLSYQNSLSNCGTVIDVNRFTFYYQIWNQANYNG